MTVSEEGRADLKIIMLTYVIFVIVGTAMMIVVMIGDSYNTTIAFVSLALSALMIVLAYWVYRGNRIAWVVSMLLSIFWLICGIIEALKAYGVITPAPDEKTSLLYALMDVLLGALMVVLLIQPTVRENNGL